MTKKISLHLNSNKPNDFYSLIQSIENTISDIQKLEIIVHIDEGDIEMMSEINNINSNYPNLVKYIETNLIESFSDAWKPLNLLLKETSKDIQIISCISDNLRFEKKLGYNLAFL